MFGNNIMEGRASDVDAARCAIAATDIKLHAIEIFAVISSR